MQLNHLPRSLAQLVRWLTHSPEVVIVAPSDFDPSWRGDHWQNLLCSPMDARHYVMEDWTLITAPDSRA